MKGVELTRYLHGIEIRKKINIYKINLNKIDRHKIKSDKKILQYAQSG